MRDREGARREALGRLGRVVPAGRDVIRRIRVEQRCEQLDVAPADGELPLPAPVRADALRLAVVVRGEEALDLA